MSLPIAHTVKNATLSQLIAARQFASDNLHVPLNTVTHAVAVAYISKHFEAGRLTGWEGFLTDNGFTSPDAEAPADYLNSPPFPSATNATPRKEK